MRYTIVEAILFVVAALPVSILTADDAIFEGDGHPQLVLEKGAGEGPAWDAKLGLLTSGDGGIWRLDRDGKQSIYRRDAGTNGLLFDHQGRLVACEPVRRRVTRTSSDGQVEVLAETLGGMRFNQPNDLTEDSHGRIYFSDPQYGDRSQMEMLDEAGRKVEGVYRIDPDGRVTRVITHEVNRPNGVIVTPDDKFLYVADNNNNEVGGARKLWRFDLRGDGGVALDSQQLIHDWGPSRGPDGMKLDRAGRLYVAGGLNEDRAPVETNEHRGGIYVFSPAGKLLTFVHIPRDEVTNCAFGGDDLRTLYITAGGTLWTLRTKTPGQVRWPQTK